VLPTLKSVDVVSEVPCRLRILGMNRLLSDALGGWFSSTKSAAGSSEVGP
jgi:hypothetical protein